MKTEQIIKKLEAIPAGRFFRIRYTTNVKLAAEYANQGYSIMKIVDTTTRTGVKYQNIEGVTPAKSNTKERANNWEWVVKDRIKHNTKTGKDYVVIAPISKGSNTKRSYVLTTPEGVTNTVNEEVVRSYTTPSYWKDNSTKPSVVTVTLDNVLMVK